MHPPIRIPYGTAPQQFGDLLLPADRPAGAPLPVVALVHGGFWRNRYALDLMEPLARDLADQGLAVWNLEYRRLGDDGGGWPGTLDDVGAAIDHLAELAPPHDLDLGHVAAVGHSAGGHLALWATGRAGARVVPLVAIGQGPVVDVRACADARLSDGVALQLLGGTPDEVPDRYAAATPRLGAGPRMVAVVGSADDIVPTRFSEDPAQPGAIEVVTIDGADHFDLIDPTHAAWRAVSEMCRAHLRPR